MKSCSFDTVPHVMWYVSLVGSSSKLVPQDLYVDTRMFAMRSADHVRWVLNQVITQTSSKCT